MSFFEELKRRKVIRVGIAYVIGAWLLLQLTEVLSELLSLPPTIGPAVVALVALGLPVALFLSWAYEITAEGIKRDSEISPDKRSSGKLINVVVVGLLMVALGYFVWESRFSDRGSDRAAGVMSEQAAAEEIGRSIAVLPFENFSGQADDDYFADGLTDTLLHKLAQISQLKVIARNSTFQFKNTNMDVREIGQILDVDTVLEGSVQRAGGQVRVIAQLVRTSDGAHIWSQSFDDSIENIFDLQDRIASSIVDAFQLTLSAAERQRLLRDGTDNPEAYDLLIRALNTRRSIDELTDSNDQDDEKVALIRQAIAADPDYALAWAELAFSYNGLAFAADSALDRDRYIAEAQSAAEEAHRLDPGLADAHNALGWVAHRKRETLRAAGHFRRALEIDPNDLGAMSGLALQIGRSDPEAMLELLNRSLELDPTAALVYRQKHFALLALGRRAEAIEQLKKAIELEPDSGIYYNDLGELLTRDGHTDQSAVWISKLLRLTPTSFDGQIAMANAWIASGHYERAAQWIELALEPRPDSDRAITLEARRLLAAGQYQQALETTNQINVSEYFGYQRAILTGSACMGLRQVECIRQSNGQVHRLIEEAKAQGSATADWNILPALVELLITELEMPNAGPGPEQQQAAARAEQLLAAIHFENTWYAKAGLAARMGDTDQAFDYLEQAVADPQGAVFNSDVFGLDTSDSLFLDPLREDIRFADWSARHQQQREAMLERMQRLEREGEIIEPATVARAGAS